MTDQYLRNTTPDSISGAVSACRGIKNSLVLINGPHGCKTYYSFGMGQTLPKASDLWGIRGELSVKDAFADDLLRSQYHTGSVHVPATNLRYEDFIFGTAGQLRRALDTVLQDRDYSLITVIQAPGTSLLSESLEPLLEDVSDRTGIPYLYIESTGLSGNFDKGYDDAVVKLLDRFARKAPAVKRTGARPSVNLFGLHDYQRYLEGDLEEITRLLDLCGIDVNLAICADCRLEDIRDLYAADANVLLTAERCGSTRDHLRKNSPIPVIDVGWMPVGPDLTERFVKQVSGALGTDCGPAQKYIEKTRAKIFYHIAKRTGGRGLPKDVRYAAEGEASMLYAFADYLTGYLGIVPEALHVLFDGTDTGGEEPLCTLLKEAGCEKALKSDISKVKDVILLGTANTIAHVLSYSGNVFGIETMCPSSGYIDVLPKTCLGCTGSLFLLEQILNGMRLLRAWE
ncbi:MAG: nitrogenase component 1 [Clostridia bacterium]|nr:nitrogenase component 1 [Clostridia bacterium]